YPTFSLFVIGSCQPAVYAVVGNVTTNDGIKIRNVNNARRRRVTLTDHDWAQFVPLKIDDVTFEGLRHDGMVGKLVREKSIPKGHVSRSDLLLRKGHDL